MSTLRQGQERPVTHCSDSSSEEQFSDVQVILESTQCLSADRNLSFRSSKIQTKISVQHIHQNIDSREKWHLTTGKLKIDADPMTEKDSDIR
jgi:hypothetical protein